MVAGCSIKTIYQRLKVGGSGNMVGFTNLPF